MSLPDIRTAIQKLTREIAGSGRTVEQVTLRENELKIETDDRVWVLTDKPKSKA